MRYLTLALFFYALAAHAAPAPQASDGATGMPTIEGPEGICSSTGEYWDGLKYVTCGELRFCRNNGCDWETPPVAAGVSTAAVAAGTGQPTELAAGADAPTPSAQATTAAAVTSANPVESPMTSVNTTVVAGASSLGISVADKGVEPSGTAPQAGANKSLVTSGGATDVAPITSGVISAQGTVETGTGAGAVADTVCVDDRPADVQKLLKLETPHDHKWTMTGKQCEPRANADTAPRFVGYWSQWSDGALPPKAEQLQGVTHLIYSFAASDGLGWTPQNARDPNPFANMNITDPATNETAIDAFKKENPGMKVLAAFGGWNLDAGFSVAADSGNMSSLAARIVQFKNDAHLDGIDIDWEYPVGGGAFYKSCDITTEDHKLPERPYERDALVDLLRHIRDQDPEAHLSVAVPAKKADRELSFPKETIEEMDLCLDDWNLMTYDMMNRRDAKTAHHAGSAVIKDVVDYYHMDGVVDKKKMNIGFSLYAKYFTLSNSTSEECTGQGGLGCDIYPAEGPAGQDLGTSGAWTFNQGQNVLTSTNVATDYTLKLAKPSWDSMPDEVTTHDAAAGASSWADTKNRMFWTWTSPKDIEQSCADHMKDVGGVMVWSINQDENGDTGGPHMEAIAGCLGGSAAGGNAGSSGASSGATAGTSASPSDQTSVNAGATSNAGTPVAGAR